MLWANMAMELPVLPTMICFRAQTSFTFPTLGQEKRNNFIPWKQRKSNDLSQSSVYENEKWILLHFCTFIMNCTIYPVRIWWLLDQRSPRLQLLHGPKTNGKGLNLIPFPVPYMYSQSVWHTPVATICTSRYSFIIQCYDKYLLCTYLL